MDLCDLLEVPAPDNHPNAGYFFEYPVTEHPADGSTTQGRIDLYKRTCFVLESKQFQEAQAAASQLQLAAEEPGVVTKKKSSQPVRGTDAWDDAITRVRAAAIAELVLWIGYLQWHFKLRGKRTPPEPILRAFKNIQCRDAVLAYDGEPQSVTWAMAVENPDLPGLPEEVRAQLRSSRRG